MKKIYFLFYLLIAALFVTIQACEDAKVPVLIKTQEDPEPDPGPGPGETYPVPAGEICEMAYTSTATTFSVWAPTATGAVVNLYREGVGGTAERTVDMTKAKDGLWEATVTGDLKGYFYTFQVTVANRTLNETAGIFAKAVGINGNRGAVIDLADTNPEGWSQDVSPALQSVADAVIYEVHFRDFSIHESAGSSKAGKFLSLSESGTVSPGGLATGVDHLKDLGITHVHILPAFDFSSIDEARPDGQYNWGYDPKNYNVPEGTYSSDAYDPEARIREFKQMVMELHRAGIRVVMDVVYNHTSDVAICGFEQTVPGYFYRMKSNGDFYNGSECGNEIASEKPMTRKFIIESVKYWAEEYHIDGFRFDLMGLHDIETMNEVQKELVKIDPNILLYGEGWAAGTPGYDQNLLAMKRNVSQFNGIAVFSDDLRAGIRGNNTIDRHGAFMFGTHGAEASICYGIAGGIEHPDVNMENVNYSSVAWASEPVQHISYVTCHDNRCLRDRIDHIWSNSVTEEEKLKVDKLAQTIVLTSQGIPLIFAGEEVFRTKQGEDNSYRSSDAVNAIDWNFKDTYTDLYEYYKGMIALRKAHPAFRLGTADKVKKHLEFIRSNNSVVAFRLKDLSGIDSAGSIIVVLNGSDRKTQVTIPQGNYTIWVEGGKADPQGLGSIQTNLIEVEARSATILGL